MSKTIEQIKADMSQLYDEVRSGATDLRKAAELTNIAGKFLKAEQLRFAQQVFAAHLAKKLNGVDKPMVLPELLPAPSSPASDEEA